MVAKHGKTYQAALFSSITYSKSKLRKSTVIDEPTLIWAVWNLAGKYIRLADSGRIGIANFPEL